MSVSTHVLDSVVGRPAAGIAVRLFAGEDLVTQGVTDQLAQITALRMRGLFS